MNIKTSRTEDLSNRNKRIGEDFKYHEVRTKPSSEKYRENYDRIFRNNKKKENGNDVN